MPYGLYVSAEGALAQSKRMDAIAHNLANVDTAGFKRQLALSQARYAEEIERGRDYLGSGSINNLGGGVLVRETKTDFSSGPIVPTGNDHDMAIDGEGAFFVVEKEGQGLLTRAGNFTIDPNNRLTTQQGYPVLSDAGTPITITDPKWTLGPDGSIQQDGAVTNLALVRPTSLDSLDHAGENLFRTSEPTAPVEPAIRRVAWKHLEMSGVKPMEEMVSMIETTRAFEANVNMIRHHDQMLGALVNRVLRTQ